MNKKLVSIILSVVMLFTLSISTTLSSAATPPFGTINGDTWTVFVDNSNTIIPMPDFYYSITPVPTWNEASWDEQVSVPSLTLEQGSVFTFTGVDLIIYTITEWDYSLLAEHSIATPPIFDEQNEGYYVFTNPGLYLVTFLNPYTGIATSGFDLEVIASAAAPTSDISVVLNGEVLEFDVSPQIIDNRTMVPMRAIFEALGAEVDWDGDTRTVVARKSVVASSTRNHQLITMQIDNTEQLIARWATPEPTSPDEAVPAVVWDYNTYTIVLDVPPMIVDNRTLVPLRAVSEAFGAEVDWDDDTQTVIIETR